MCLESVNQITVWRVNPETCVESVSMKKNNFCETFAPNMGMESVNQITVWRVNPETCVESVSMKKMNFCENSKLLNLTCARRV